MRNRYNITGLYPSAHYQVWVVAKSPFGFGEPSSLINVSTEPGGMSCSLRECRVVCFMLQAACRIIIGWAVNQYPMCACCAATSKVPGLLH